MRNGLQIKVNGMKEIQRAFAKSPGIMEASVRGGVGLGTQAVKREAMKESPVDEGTLKNSHFQTPIRRRGRFAYSASVQPNVKYGIWVHEGTSRGIKPNRWMERARDGAAPVVERVFGRAIKEALAKITK